MVEGEWRNAKREVGDALYERLSSNTESSSINRPRHRQAGAVSCSRWRWLRMAPSSGHELQPWDELIERDRVDIRCWKQPVALGVTQRLVPVFR